MNKKITLGIVIREKREKTKFRDMILPWLWVNCITDPTPHLTEKNKTEGKELKNHIAQLYNMKPKEAAVQLDWDVEQ